MFARLSNWRHRRTIGCGRQLVRLARDTAGNTLIIVAAAILPLLAMIGSGIDMSRAYMAQARLQQACDAASLAGRRAMSTGAIDATVTSEVNKFFNFNFPQGTFGTASFTPATTLGANQTVVITASTTIPTSIMRIFGFATLPLSATCNASQNFVNTDILLVLDTTGSMADKAVSTDSDSKIVGLRNAVMALYDQLAPVQTQLEAVGLRLRYGIVPYSSSVNVGNLIKAVNPAYLNDSAAYQSRVANYTTPVYVGTDGTPANSTETYGSSIKSSDCSNYATNDYPSSGANPVTSGTAPSNVTTTTYSYGSWTKTSGSGSTAKGTCVRNKSVVTTTYETRYKFTSYSYQQTSGTTNYDTSTFKTGAAITLATNNGGSVAISGSYNDQQLAAAATNVTTAPATTALTTTTSAWSGCIEERKTVSTINSTSGYTIPSGANDLNIDLIPTSDALTRWTPHWPDIIYTRGSLGNAPTSSSSGSSMKASDSSYYACPSAAVGLTAWTRADLLAYVNGLNPLGGTYHDIGMIWGGRLISQNGIFSASNPSTYNSMPVSRYIIFLTDGAMAPNYNTYTSYGVEYLDQRVTGSSSATNQLSDHVQRFLVTCNAIKSMNVSIWVIGFAQALDSSLTTCASNSSQAVTSSNQTDLLNQFVQIGKNIGSLRLTK